MELIVSPGILFLDEPTSGLDAATAVTMMQYLYKSVLTTYYSPVHISLLDPV